MIVEKVDPVREAFNDYSLEKAMLTVGGIEVDLAAEQGDQEVIITFASCNGRVYRGMMTCCEYVADVIIPPRKYDLVEVENEGEESNTYTGSVPIPLDLDSVTLKLWPVLDRGENEEQGDTSC
jgi:hypothetical protein